MNILVNTSLGELVDKITILEIKQKNISDEKKLININKELSTLNKILESSDISFASLSVYKKQLQAVNQKLWKIEDDLRDCEREQKFDETFIELARAVYFTNDQRADIKKQINIAFGSELVEEKSYQNYK